MGAAADLYLRRLVAADRTTINKLALHVAIATLVVLAFFFGTLFVLNAVDPDTPVINNARAISAALERHHAAKGLYPVLPERDSPVSVLTPVLVGGGFMSVPPQTFEGMEPIRYYSPDGKAFGLLLRFKNSPPCKVVARDAGKLWWGETIPYCLNIAGS